MPNLKTAYTGRELSLPIGCNVTINLDGLSVDCIVLDTKASWGQFRLLVKPVAGDGEKWIDAGRLLRVSQPQATAIRPVGVL